MRHSQPPTGYAIDHLHGAWIVSAAAADRQPIELAAFATRAEAVAYAWNDWRGEEVAA